MIRQLTGSIARIGEQWLVLDVRGVGYLILMPSPMLSGLTPGEQLTCYTHLAVRETALDLYGFTDTTTLTVFELLLNVPSVGPKSALQIMSQATPALLSEAVAKDDPVYLHKLSGIGKKTCEKVVQFLKDRQAELPATDARSDHSLAGVQSDAIDALVALGYDGGSAREAILAIEITDETTANTLITQALRQLGNQGG